MRAVLCGYYGMGNGGDEALLATLLQLLPPSVTPLVLSGDPDQTRRRYGVQAIARKSAFSLLQTLPQSDAFIWGGGSLMQDATSAVNPLYYGGLMGLAQGMGLKTIAWAQGIGPLKRSPTRWITRRAFQGCDAISVRDGKSGKWLNRQHINQFILAPDPVWALEAAPSTDTSALPDPRIAVVLRDHATLTPERLTAIAQGLRHLQLATQASILLIPFQPVVDRPIPIRLLSHPPSGKPRPSKRHFPTGPLDPRHAPPRPDHGRRRRIPLLCPQLRSQSPRPRRRTGAPRLGSNRRSPRPSHARDRRSPRTTVARGFPRQHRPLRRHPPILLRSRPDAPGYPAPGS